MHKILIVEDDLLVANIYRNKFLLEDFQVETAVDGETALRLVDSFRPDLVLLDLMLPKMSGVELMKAIRARPEFSKLPLVVFSNTFLTNLVREAWAAGATKCLSKASCTPKQVIAVARSAIANPGPPTAKARTSADPMTAPSLSPPGALHQFAEVTQEPLQESQGTFAGRLPGVLANLRSLLQAVTKAEYEADKTARIEDLYRQMHWLTGSAAVAHQAQIAHLAEALEALLKELNTNPKKITASPLRTLASAIDLLAMLFQRAAQPQEQATLAPRILVVDDDPISRRAVSRALEKTKLGGLAVEDPLAAHKLLSENPFDLIFLDVDMPGMNGFELCAKLRALPLHAETPVVFVTGLDDFESRTSSTVSGGTDYIVKPFLFMELGVKALVYLQKRRLQASVAS